MFGIPYYLHPIKLSMLKDTIIILSLCLLISTTSNITLFSAQARNKQNPAGITAEQSSDTEPDNGVDYYWQVRERFVKSALKTLYVAQSAYIQTVGNGSFGTLDSLKSAGLIDDALASGEKYYYVFSVTARHPSGTFPPGFTITAKPLRYGKGGKTSFYMDASCRIRGGDKRGLDANANDPILDNCSPSLSYGWEYDIWLGMRQLQTAQRDYFNNLGRYGSLHELIDAGLINQQLSNSWYMWLTMQVTPPSKSSPARFRIWGTPQVYRETGVRSFYADESGVLRGGDFQGMPANENSPPLIFEDEDLIKYAMRSLSTAQRRYIGISDYGNGNYAINFNQLADVRFIDDDLRDGISGGYQFVMTVNNSEIPWLESFEIRAIPLNYGKPTVRSFYISNISLLRGADKDGNYADINDPLIEF